MSANQKYALGIIKQFNEITAAGVKAAAVKVMTDVVRNTQQDSGQAAFNWKFSINSKSQRQRFLNRINVAPVGAKDSKGANKEAVISHKVNEITAALASVPAKNLKSVMIYHPMNPEWRYSNNAKLQEAAIIASNSGSMNATVAAAIRKAGG